MTDNEYFGITLMREAIDLFEQGVTQGLADPDIEMPRGEAMARMETIKRLVNLAAKWFEQHFMDESGTYDTTLQFLKCVYNDLLAEGLEEFLKYCDKKKSWVNANTAPLWSAGVTYVYLRMVRTIRNDSQNLEVLGSVAPYTIEA